MKHHHARGPEKTVFDLPPLVPAKFESRRPPTRLRKKRNVRLRDGKRHKPVGGSGTPGARIIQPRAPITTMRVPANSMRAPMGRIGRR